MDMSGKAGLVLVVDDDFTACELLSEILAGGGFKVLCADGAESGFDLARGRRPDVALLDIMLPGADGLELCARMKADPSTRGIPVLFITGLGDTDSRLSCFRSGGVDYIQKPFRGEEILARVETQLRLRRYAASLEELNDKLELKVAERTLELAAANELLRAELLERQRVELELRKSTVEKDLLLHEVQDRVRNNLQVITSLASITLGRLEDPSARMFYRELVCRLHAMAEVHEQLYSTGRFDSVDISEYIKRRLGQAYLNYRDCFGDVEIDMPSDKVELGLDQAVPCCMLVNEIIVNSFRHAFPVGRPGKGRVFGLVCRKDDGRLLIELGDDGVGLPPLSGKREGTGRILIALLAGQLHAELGVEGPPGTRYTILLPSPDRLRVA